MEKLKPVVQERELDPRVEAAIALYKLIEGCEKYNVAFTFEYDTGKSVDWAVLERYGHDEEAIPENEVNQGPKGFRINVGSYSLTGDDGNEKLFPTLGEAAEAGNHILQRVLRGEK